MEIYYSEVIFNVIYQNHVVTCQILLRRCTFQSARWGNWTKPVSNILLLNRCKFCVICKIENWIKSCSNYKDYLLSSRLTLTYTTILSVTIGFPKIWVSYWISLYHRSDDDPYSSVCLYNKRDLKVPIDSSLLRIIY